GFCRLPARPGDGGGAGPMPAVCGSAERAAVAGQRSMAGGARKTGPRQRWRGRLTFRLSAGLVADVHDLAAEVDAVPAVDRAVLVAAVIAVVAVAVGCGHDRAEDGSGRKAADKRAPSPAAPAAAVPTASAPAPAAAMPAAASPPILGLGGCGGRADQQRRERRCQESCPCWTHDLLSLSIGGTAPPRTSV